jgi:RHS repeat-associated protein
MTFDGNGNLTTMTESGQSTSYTWNTRDQLTALAGPGLSASFAYDALARRSSKTVAGQMTTFQYDALDIVGEAGPAAVNYLRSLTIDEPLARIESAATPQYLSDGLGSTLALTDGIGTVATTYTYGPFGQTSSSGPASPNPFQFTARDADGTGLIYYRSRYYGPSMARFISEDLLAGINRYRYTSNNPLRYKDPLGLLDYPGGEAYISGPDYSGLVDPQALIDELARNFNTCNIKGIVYDPAIHLRHPDLDPNVAGIIVGDDGRHAPRWGEKGTVVIGPSALANPYGLRLGHPGIRSVILHEIVHGNDYRLGTPMTRHMTEYRAFSKELESVGQLGLTPDIGAWLQRQIQARGSQISPVEFDIGPPDFTPNLPHSLGCRK